MEFALSLPTWLSAGLSAHFGLDLPYLMGQVSFLPNLLISVLLGAILGFERRKRNKSAGLRTHIVLCLSTCLITISGVDAAVGSDKADPTRLATQILSGIGFIGAGVILRQGFATIGVTTAASILLVTGVGIACGFGLYPLAFTCTLLNILALYISTRYFPGIRTSGMGSETEDGEPPIKFSLRPEKFAEIRELLGDHYKLLSVVRKDNLVKVTVSAKFTNEQREKLMDRLISAEDILSMETSEDLDTDPDIDLVSSQWLRQPSSVS